MHVFTYGTLMFREVWKAVVGREFTSVGGVATGFANYRVRDAVFPGMLASEFDRTHGVVYLDVDHSSVARLDLFEDDFYERQTIWVECDDGHRRAADAYVVPPANQSVLTVERWDANQFIESGGLDEFIRRFQGFGRVSQVDELP
jgi:gamma-glutamylcyclotransferase (GGCT)/AIG2-like uncharacterized protein YtfP